MLPLLQNQMSNALVFLKLSNFISLRIFAFLKLIAFLSFEIEEKSRNIATENALKYVIL